MSTGARPEALSGLSNRLDSNPLGKTLTMKQLIIAVAATALSLGAYAASHAEKGAMAAKPAASGAAAKAAPAAKPASAPAKKTTSAKHTKKSASAPA